MNTHGDRDPVPERSLREFAERCKAEARSVEIHPDKILELLNAEARVAELTARVGELEEHLKRALGQWQMYAEFEPERDIANDLDAEATEYQKSQSVLSGSPAPVGEAEQYKRGQNDMFAVWNQECAMKGGCSGAVCDALAKAREAGGE